MNTQRAVVSIVSVLLVMCVGSCGYTTKVTLPYDIKTIYVPNFKNEIPQTQQYTYESGLEIDVTNAVIDRLLFDGTLQVVKEAEADAILRGSVVGYSQETLRYTDLEGVRQYRLFIITKLALEHRTTGDIIWEEKHFTGDSEFFIEGAEAVSERAAADEAIEDIAKRIVDRIVEDW